MPAVHHQVVTIEAKNVQWRVMRGANTRHLIAVCDALNLCLEAESETELRSLIPEAMHTLMVDLFEDNEIEQYLREKGWRALNLPARPDGDIRFDVPWELIAEGARRDSERRAH
jgi:hypothetical protein